MELGVTFRFHSLRNVFALMRFGLFANHIAADAPIPTVTNDLIFKARFITRSSFRAEQVFRLSILTTNFTNTAKNSNSICHMITPLSFVIKPIFEVSFSSIQGNYIENVRMKERLGWRNISVLNKWKWIQLKTNEMNRVQAVNEQDHNMKDWLKHARKSKNNYLRVDFLENGEKVVKGSLIYQKSFDEEQDFKIFHFYLTKNLLVTVDLELTVLKQIKSRSSGTANRQD